MNPLASLQSTASSSKIDGGRLVEVPSTLKVRASNDQLLQDICAAPLRRPLVVTGTVSGELLGCRVADALDRPSATVVTSNGFAEVKRVVSTCLDAHAQSVVAVGGGRVVDVAKFAAHKLSLPLVSVPTQVSHDGICSPVAVIQFEDGFTRSVGATTPWGVFVALDLVLDAPKRSIRSGLGDLISNLSATRDWQLAAEDVGEPVDDYAFLLANLAAGSVYRAEAVGGDGVSIVEPLIQGLVMSGIAMSIAGNSRPCSGAEHKISHALDLLYGGRALHGLQVALGMVFAEFLRGGDRLQELLPFFRLAGLPVTHADLGFSADEMVAALVEAPGTRPNRWTILEKVGMDREIAEGAVGAIAELASAHSQSATVPA